MNHQKAKQIALISAGVIGGFLLLNAAIWGIFYNRAYPGVKVGDISLGAMDRLAVRAQLGSKTQDYRLVITAKGTSTEIRASDIDLNYNLEQSTSDAVHTGKQYIVPLYGLIYTWLGGDARLRYSYDAQKLLAVATQIAGPESKPAVDAKVVISGESVTVEADQAGQGIDPDVVSDLIKQRAATVGKTASVSKRPTKAKINQAEAQSAADQAQKVMALPVSIHVGDKSFTPDKVEIGKWLAFTANDRKKLLVTANSDAINAYIASIAAQVDVAPVVKQINMVNGVVRTVNEGKNGLSLDRGALVEALSSGIKDTRAVSATGTLATVAYKTRTNSTVDLEGKYIEVNVSRQHLWAYNNKQLVFDTPITSGATGAGFATIQGLFSIKAKQTNRNLNGVPLGYDYNVFVQYWMPFSGNYGMHDASWRSSFGGADYYYGGSHGCVNLPTSAAAWVYNFVDIGTPVWVHS